MLKKTFISRLFYFMLDVPTAYRREQTVHELRKTMIAIKCRAHEL